MGTGRLAILASSAVVAMIVVVFTITQLRTPAERFAACLGGSVAGGAIGGPFELMRHDGQMVTDADVLTQPSLVYFGYTFCPDYCPNDLARNAIAVDILDDANHSVLPVFITIDPARDTAAHMGEYVASHHPRMVGLTGTAQQVARAARAYKVYYKRADDDPEYYLMDHSTMTYLMLPGHGFVDFFRSDEAPDMVAKRVACFLDAA